MNNTDRALFLQPTEYRSLDSPLFQMCVKGNFGQIMKALSNPIGNIFEFDSYGRQALHMASTKAVTKALITFGFDPNMMSSYGYCLLHEACTHGHIDVVEYLHEVAGFDMDIKTGPMNQLPDFDGVSLDRDIGLTGLHLACMNDQHDIVELLLEYKCNPNNISTCGLNPLHYTKDEKIAEILIEAHCDVNSKGHLGDTPLHTAIVRDNVGMVQVLLDAGCEREDMARDKMNPLLQATFRGKRDIVELLIKNGCNVQVRSFNGGTLLHVAIYNIDVLDYLLEYNQLVSGMMLDSVNDNGETPLHCAISQQQIDTAKRLIRSGASILAVNNKNESCLHYAVQNNLDDIAFIRLLVEEGVDLFIKDSRDNYACEYANDIVGVDNTTSIRQYLKDTMKEHSLVHHGFKRDTTMSLSDKGGDGSLTEMYNGGEDGSEDESG